MEPTSPAAPALQADSILLSHQGSPRGVMASALYSWMFRDTVWQARLSASRKIAFSFYQLKFRASCHGISPVAERSGSRMPSLDHHKGHALDRDASQVLSVQPHPYPDHLSHQGSLENFHLPPDHELSTKRDLRATYARAWPQTCSGAPVFFNQTLLRARLWREQVETPSQQLCIRVPILLLRNNGTSDKSCGLTGSTGAKDSSYLRGLL